MIAKESISEIAQQVIHRSPSIIFGSVVLAGWLMALLSWLVVSSNETSSRIFGICMIATTIGFAGLHHSTVGNIEVLAGLIFINDISESTYTIFHSTALFGNAFGGVIFVAPLKYRSCAANL
ncbi:formate/nitrite transporter family protein [Aggregatimonas sangjinii]|uniref:formate/nitrite transporter family protein n=1 Tax=Aggregatimonas sangjinii TaxID=2583587 RepID=UPI0015866614|nr:formate/nitrite transporter family protein [Aggregatimonas sangjinii]